MYPRKPIKNNNTLKIIEGMRSRIGDSIKNPRPIKLKTILIIDVTTKE
jgi:hypothetical protein